jgi:hypothetical protein
MDHGKTNIVARRFVGTCRISDESGELHDGQVPGVGILHEGSDKSAPSKCAAGGTFRENPGGVPDPESANGTEAVATVKVHWAPPSISFMIARNAVSIWEV